MARLHNICLPRILADDQFKERHLQSKGVTQTIKGTGTNVLIRDVDVLARNQVNPSANAQENIAEIVDENEFKIRNLPKNRGTEMAINLSSTRECTREQQDESNNLDREFGIIGSLA